jgi:hypothetical protein
MSKLSVMEQLHSEWNSAKIIWEAAQTEVNVMMLEFCLGKGRAPSRKKLDDLANKFKEMSDARLELDKFMREYASAPKREEVRDGSIEISGLFIQATRNAES